MLDTTKSTQKKPRLAITLSPDHPVDGSPVSQPEAQTAPLPEAATSLIFPISAIVHEEHPRQSAWAGLAEACQILAEAEAHKGSPLTFLDLRTLMLSHLDGYEPNWHFHLREIADAWMAGWEHAFALAAQRTERLQYSDPLSGIGLFGGVDQAPVAETAANEQRTTVHFRHARLRVTQPEDFFQGVWEGQCTALDVRDPDQTRQASQGGEAAASLSAVWCFDELLDLFYELGNHRIDYAIGYVLGLCEGLLYGRTNAPDLIQRESTSVSVGAIEKS